MTHKVNQSGAMMQPGTPVPASDVPCDPALGLVNTMQVNTGFDDRAYALAGQDSVCFSGKPPAGLPTWPPASTLEPPRSARMESADDSEVATRAAIMEAQRDGASAGVVQPATVQFETAADGSLVAASVPALPASPQRVVAAGAQAARQAAHTDGAGFPAAAPPATGGAVAERRQGRQRAGRVGEALRRHAHNLVTAVPGLVSDLVHYKQLRAKHRCTDTVAFIFGREQRGLYLAVVLSLLACIVSAARTIRRR